MNNSWLVLPQAREGPQFERHSLDKQTDVSIGLRQSVRSTLAAALLLTVAGCGSHRTESSRVEGMPTPVQTILDGAGTSAPMSLFNRWFGEMVDQGIKVNYQSVGSGMGIMYFRYNMVDFAASEVPMSAEEVARERRGVVQVPITASAHVVAYQHKGCDLKLSQAQLVGIYEGTITNYSELGCAAKPIKVVVRSDGSGTTANFTAHLSAISPSWKQKVGSAKLVKWPVGTGANRNEGVAAQLKKVDGALGVVNQVYAEPPLQMAALTNGAGQLVKPTAESQRQALASIDLGPALTRMDHNPRLGYPLVTFVWVLLYKTGNGPTDLASLNKAFGYALSEPAQALADPLGYVSLPAPLLEKSRAALATIQP
jgi:phosphate transport system substrate-binding protein